MTIGEIISTRRKALGMTLDEIAKKVGTTKSTVHRWESGYIKSIPSDKVAPLVRVLQISPQVLAGSGIVDDAASCDEDPQIEPVKYNLNGIDALAVLEHGLEDWLGIKGKGEPTAEAELVSIGAYPEYAELTFKHNDNTYAFVFRKENK